MWKTAEELLSPIEHTIDYLKDCIYNTDDIFTINVEQEIGGDIFAIYFFTKGNRKITFALFPYDNSVKGEAKNSFELAQHYLKNIYKNLKE